METLATFLAPKFAERPLLSESEEKFQEKQTEFASRIAKVGILPFGRGLVRSGAVPVENGESFA